MDSKKVGLFRLFAYGYTLAMTTETRWLIYPDGDRQECDSLLRVDQVVDMNGFPLPMPPPSPRIIAYRVYKVRRVEERGQLDVLQYLELVPASELASMMGGRWN